MKNVKKCDITEINVPNGSGDIPFPSQEPEQDGRRHFVVLQPLFYVSMTSQTQSCKKMKKVEVQYLRSLLFNLFEIFRLLEVIKGISLDFKFRCYGNLNQNNCL